MVKERGCEAENKMQDQTRDTWSKGMDRTGLGVKAVALSRCGTRGRTVALYPPDHTPESGVGGGESGHGTDCVAVVKGGGALFEGLDLVEWHHAQIPECVPLPPWIMAHIAASSSSDGTEVDETEGADAPHVLGVVFQPRAAIVETPDDLFGGTFPAPLDRRIYRWPIVFAVCVSSRSRADDDGGAYVRTWLDLDAESCELVLDAWVSNAARASIQKKAAHHGVHTSSVGPSTSQGKGRRHKRAHRKTKSPAALPTIQVTGPSAILPVPCDANVATTGSGSVPAPRHRARRLSTRSDETSDDAKVHATDDLAAYGDREDTDHDDLDDEILATEDESDDTDSSAAIALGPPRRRRNSKSAPSDPDETTASDKDVLDDDVLLPLDRGSDSEDREMLDGSSSSSSGSIYDDLDVPDEEVEVNEPEDVDEEAREDEDDIMDDDLDIDGDGDDEDDDGDDEDGLDDLENDDGMCDEDNDDPLDEDDDPNVE